MDNYFSAGDEILKFLGERGWKATMTCRRDRLPKDVNRMYFHHLKGQKVDNRSRVARFEQPVIAVKQVTHPMILENVTIHSLMYPFSLQEG